MNYAQARQVSPQADRPDAGKWRWTVRNDNAIWTEECCTVVCPADHCPGAVAWEKMRGTAPADTPKCETCHGRGRIADDGHDTAEEAAEHYRQWRIDHARFRTLNNPNALHKCRVDGCGKFTAGVMEIEGDAYSMEIVCEDHQTRETAEKLIERTSGSAYS